MQHSPEFLSKVARWRARAIEGTLTEAEMVEAVKEMRAGRYGAAMATEKAKTTRAKAAVPDADDLLKEMGDL